MAKLLAYKRATQQVVTLDTVQPAITVVGTSLPLADITSALPGRSQNLVSTFLGDPYLLYRTTLNEIRLAKYVAGVWTNSVGFGVVTTGSGALTPIGLVVVQDVLVALYALSGSAGIDGLIAKQSTDGATWSLPVSLLNPLLYQPGTTNGGHVMSWRNAVWITGVAGIAYYDPVGDVFGAAFDTGSDADIADQKVTFGAFASYSDDLYYLLPTTSALQTPKLYKLDSAWSVAIPVAVPAWTKVVVSIASAGPLFVGPDNGVYSLFTNKAGALTAWFSGNNETKVVTFVSTTTGLTASDVTTATLDLTVRSLVNAGWSLMSDDRRRTNERQTIVCRDIAASPQKIHVLTWDGASPATLDETFASLDLILTNDERGDFRIFTDLLPGAFITAFTQPFPGRVQLNYTVRDSLSRPVDVFGEYSLDKQTWLPMTQGDGDSGATALVSTPVGSPYFYYWDAFQDIDGNLESCDVRIVVRISGV